MYFIKWDYRIWTGNDWVAMDQIKEALPYEVYVAAAQQAMKLVVPCQVVSSYDLLLFVMDRDKFAKASSQVIEELRTAVVELQRKNDSLVNVNKDLLSIQTNVSSGEENQILDGDTPSPLSSPSDDLKTSPRRSSEQPECAGEAELQGKSETD